MPSTLTDQTLRWLADHLFHFVGVGFLVLCKREWDRHTLTMTNFAASLVQMTSEVQTVVQRMEKHAWIADRHEEDIRELRRELERRKHVRELHIEE